MFEIILIPINTLHIGVGKVRVNDNIKKTKPSNTKTKPIFLLFKFNTSHLYIVANICNYLTQPL